MAVPPGVYHLPPFKLIAFSFESAAFESQIKPQGPEEMCLSLETNMVYFDRVTVSLHIISYFVKVMINCSSMQRK